MLQKDNTKTPNTSNIKKLISREDYIDKYILDSENAIIVVNKGRVYTEDRFFMIHKRIENGKLVEVNRWQIKEFTFEENHEKSIIRDKKLFKIKDASARTIGVYDYKKGKFVVPINAWDSIEFGNNNRLIEMYNGFLATFSISSDQEPDDIYSYISPVSDKRVVEIFKEKDGDYFAILNIDGTIRGKKIFKGTSFSNVEKVIDLSKYESLEAFKIQRRKLCNDRKKREKQKYYKRMGTMDKDVSAYFDTEVAKVLNLKK